MADTRRIAASLACCVLGLVAPALADPITRAQLLARVDRSVLQSKHRIDTRLLSSLKLGALLSIDAVEPSAPSDGAELVVRYVLTNFTLDSTRGIVTGLFQQLELVGVDGAAPSLFELAAGGTVTGALRTRAPVREGASRLQVAFQDRAECRDRPDRFGRPMRVCNPGLSASTALDVTVGPDLARTDLDHDGIPDAVERRLLARFTPYLRFSRRNGVEQYRPMDVLNYVRWSELQTVGDEGEGVIVTNAALAADPNALLGQGSDVTEEKRFRRSDRYLNPLKDVPAPGGDWARHGWAWDDVLVRRNVGLYGHVVPFRAVEPQTTPLRCPQSRGGIDSIEEWVVCAIDRGAETAQTWYKVEYWQFFGYSDSGQGFEIAHHEADWVTVQVVVDPASEELVQVHHFFHGRNASFDLRRNPAFWELEGGAVREHRGFNWGLEVDFTWHEGPLARVKNELSAAHAQDNSVRLLKDPETGRFDHPVVYVENGAHEFWPTEAWSFQDAPNHDGDDEVHSYLAAAPPNLGEVEAPLAEVAEASLILRYNGRWGAFSRKNDPPQGPALHDQWTWPASSSIRWLLDARLGR